MPVPIAPMMPPMQCTPNTSRESSYPTFGFTTEQKRKQTEPATKPSTIDPIGPAKPDAGVTATRPATAPETMPSSEGVPFNIHSVNIQPSVAAAVATMVFTKASEAIPVASRFEPALKPNQPTQRSEAPIIDITTECGGSISPG